MERRTRTDEKTYIVLDVFILLSDSIIYNDCVFFLFVRNIITDDGFTHVYRGWENDAEFCWGREFALH
jgi:hypothetical protein